jgi:trigger factor
MDIQLETPTATKKIVNVSIPKATVADELSKEFQKIRKKASVKGFRKGKVPLNMIKSMYGDSAKYEVMNRLINDSLSKAIAEKEILYVGDPVVKDVSELDENEDLKITAEFDCIEEFEIKDYKGIEIEVETFHQF